MAREGVPPGRGQRRGGGAVAAPQEAGVDRAGVVRQAGRLAVERLVERRGAAFGRPLQRGALGEVAPAHGARMPPGRALLRREPAGDEGVEVAGEQHVGREPERDPRVRRRGGEGDLGADPARIRRQRRIDAGGRGEARHRPALGRVVAVGEADEADARDRPDRRQHPARGTEAGGVDDEPGREIGGQVRRPVGRGRRERERRSRRPAAQQHARADVAGREPGEQRRRRGPAGAARGQDRRRARPERARERAGAPGVAFGQRAQPRAGVRAQRRAAARDHRGEPQRGFLAPQLQRAPGLAEEGLAQRFLHPHARRLGRQVEAPLEARIEALGAGLGRGHRTSVRRDRPGAATGRRVRPARGRSSRASRRFGRCRASA